MLLRDQGWHLGLTMEDISIVPKRKKEEKTEFSLEDWHHFIKERRNAHCA